MQQPRIVGIHDSSGDTTLAEARNPADDPTLAGEANRHAALLETLRSSSSK